MHDSDHTLSPEFSPEYQQQLHYRRLRNINSRPAPKRNAGATKSKISKARKIERILIIQMADLPRYHYEVWADFNNGRSELLQHDYIHGLKNAVSVALEKWGNHHRIVLERYNPKKYLPPLVINVNSCTQQPAQQELF